MVSYSHQQRSSKEMHMELTQVGDFCPNEICPDYGKTQSDQQRNIKKAGKTKKGRQRYQCKTCGQTFVETKGTLVKRQLEMDIGDN
jgi:hypothetical protein